MRRSLRRSCTACARSKHSCDLRTPRCSRCSKRKILCVYENEPLTAPLTYGSAGAETSDLIRQYATPGSPTSSLNHTFAALDPFEAYPRTRLPREQVQRLIHNFLHKIAFQYYPLDLSSTSNPFLISWWPLALGDPALFHVSLQTACLDEERHAQKGFKSSEILMADSVALLRHKIVDAKLALQDGTMNSVITLATIEFGKGNTDVGRMHVNGVKKLVDMRGGINAVRQTSPLTARMVSWASMLIMGHPQFDTQDDDGIGHGIPPIREWQLDSNSPRESAPELLDLDVDFPVQNVFIRLRKVFHQARTLPLPTTQLHDLACFVIHRLLLYSSDSDDSQPSPETECIRCAIILYMFTIHGPTYYSHDHILNPVVAKLKDSLDAFYLTRTEYNALDVWLLATGIVTSPDSALYYWFVSRARAVAASLRINTWEDAFLQIKSMLWLETPQGEEKYRPHWLSLLYAIQAEPLDLSDFPHPSSTGAQLS